MTVQVKATDRMGAWVKYYCKSRIDAGRMATELEAEAQAEGRFLVVTLSLVSMSTVQAQSRSLRILQPQSRSLRIL